MAPRELGDRAVTLSRYRERWYPILFPAASPSRRRLSAGWTAVVLGGLFVLAITLQVLRIGPLTAFDAIWAEDGTVLLQDAVQHGFFEALTSKYATYLLIAPRLIGAAATLVPLRDAPFVFGLGAAGLVALSGYAVWVGAAGHVPNRYLRALLVVALVLSPVASLEAVDAASYAIWYMLFGTFWLLFWRPSSDWAGVLGGAFILLTTLSTPGVWFFAPVALLRALGARDRRDRLLLGAYGLGSLIQIPVIATSAESTVEPVWTNDTWASYLQRVLNEGIFGEDLGGKVWLHFEWAGLIILLLVAVVGFAVGIARAKPAARALAVVAIATSVGMFAVSAYQRAVGAALMWPANVSFGFGGRYVIVPALLLLSAALALIAQPSRPRRGPAAISRLGLAAVVVVLVATATSFRVADPVRGTPTWHNALDAARAGCANTGKSQIEVASSPLPVKLPCAEVVR